VRSVRGFPRRVDIKRNLCQSYRLSDRSRCLSHLVRSARTPRDELPTTAAVKIARPSNPWNHASIRHRAVVPRCQHQGDRPGASPRFGPASAVSFARQSIGGPLTDARGPEGVVAECQDRRRDPRAGDEKVFLSCVKALRPDIIVVARRCSRLPQNCSCLPPKARRCGQGIFMGLTMPSP
jgi:hypothetical protein